MRAVILGPVINSTSKGGVSTITESLAKGFQLNGDEVKIISIEKSDYFKNEPIRRHKNKFLIFFSFNKIAKLIKEYKPEIVISSLEYSVGIKKYKAKYKNATYISFIHGIAVSIKGRRIRSKFVNFAAKYAAKYADHTTISSYLMQTINKKIYKLNCDRVICNGIEINNFNTNVLNINRKYDFLYLGRLAYSKNIELMCDAFCGLHKKDPKLKFAIVGGGELESLFLAGGKFNGLDFIDYFGQVYHDQVFDYFKNSKFFISLCDLEGYGTVFMEAALQGCNLVSTYCQGQNQSFVEKPYYHIVDINSLDKLISDLENTIKKYSIMPIKDLIEYSYTFSNKRMALEYKLLVNQK